MRDWEAKEEHDAMKAQGPPPISEHYYTQYSDVIGRMGVAWFERVVLEWEGDYGKKREIRMVQS